MINAEISNRVRQCVTYEQAYTCFELLADRDLIDNVEMYFASNHAGEITIDLLADVIGRIDTLESDNVDRVQ